jgi:hypothetical protein
MFAGFKSPLIIPHEWMNSIPMTMSTMMIAFVVLLSVGSAPRNDPPTANSVLIRTGNL